MSPQPSPAQEPATGSQIYRLAAVMDRLRGPDGCPWDARQDHASLVQYLLEEAYEVADAIETDDRVALREELGDVLLQVVFHAAIARAEPQPFDLDDVASDVADKLIRRHPHVFDETDDAGPHLTAEQSYARWDRIKAHEKARTSVLDGIPTTQGALARTHKVVGRARRGGLDVAALAAPLVPSADEPEASSAIGGRLLAVILDAETRGIDAEGALRGTMRALEEAIRAEEDRATARGSAHTPGAPDRPAATGTHSTRR
ncbi:MAG: MazG family protein [Bifidobacteriaceae bacterium]|jgi:XTP/dITP diphosphohydrolase|nr:MazG family protein [Bifidobacteriaceae bacterium]